MRACNCSTVACARPCSVTETLANFLCHPRQGSGRIDVATELGDDGSDPRLVVAVHFLAQRGSFNRVQWRLLLGLATISEKQLHRLDGGARKLDLPSRAEQAQQHGDAVARAHPGVQPGLSGKHTRHNPHLIAAP
jgi:hypothetical protein